jgi:predicted nucleic acid-binding protein
VLHEADSHIAQALAASEEELLVPDFWLSEACDVLWMQVRRGIFSPDEAREGLALLRAQVEPTPTGELGLHDVALEIGLAIGHSPYDTLYLAFAVAIGAEKVVVADRKFATAIEKCPGLGLSDKLILLGDWGTAQGVDRGRSGSTGTP